MKRFLLLSAAVTLALTSTVPVQAGGGDVAAGLIGGLAAGTIIGAAVTAPPLLWSAASVCGAGAILLLDARTAGVGPIPRRVDVPGCQGVQVGFIARTASPCTIPELPPHRRKSRRHSTSRHAPVRQPHPPPFDHLRRLEHPRACWVNATSRMPLASPISIWAR